MNARKIQMQQIFGFVVIFYVTSNMLAQTKFSGILPIGAFITLSRISVYAFLFLRLVLTSRIKKTQLLLLPLLFALAVIVTLTSEKKIIIDTIAILLAARKYDPYKIMWDIFRVQFAVLAITIFASEIGVIANTATFQVGYSFAREGLGFNYTTYGPNYFFHLILSFIVLKGNKVKLWQVIALEAINVFLYLKTNTTAVFYMGGLALLFVYIARFVKKPLEETKLLKTMFYLMIPLSVAIAFFTAIYYNPLNYRWSALNTILSGRLRLAHFALNEYSISPLGQFIQWNTSLQKSSNGTMAYFYVDSSYINIALVYGWIVLALICISFIVLMRRGVKENNIMLCLAISFLALHSIFDPQLIELRYNLLLLCIAPLLNLGDIKKFRGKRTIISFALKRK